MTALLEFSAPAVQDKMKANRAQHVLINAQLLSTDASYRSAGVSQYSRNLVRELGVMADGEMSNYQLSAFTSAERFHVPGVQIYRDDLLPFRRGIHNPIERILWEQTRLNKHAANMQVDLIHGLVNVLPLSSPVPGVVTVHDLSFLRFPKLFHWTKRTYLTYLCRESASRAEQIIAVSQQTADDLMEYFGTPASKIKIVHNGVDERFHPGTPAENAMFREHKGLPDRFMLYLGTLEPRKNLELLVRAFADWKANAGTISSDHSDFKLVLAGGKGWFYEEIFATVKELALEDDVIFPGFIPEIELPDWYRAAEIFIYPSRFEGFGLPVLEAMSCGVPVICSQASSLVELVKDAAMTVPTDDVEALSRAIEQLTNNQAMREDLRQRGLARSSLFSWAQAAEQTLDVYDIALSCVKQNDGYRANPNAVSPSAVNSSTGSPSVHKQHSNFSAQHGSEAAESSSTSTMDTFNNTSINRAAINQSEISRGDVGRSSVLPNIQEKLMARFDPGESPLARGVQKVDTRLWPYLLIASDMLLTFITCIVAYHIRYSLQWFLAVDPAYEIELTTFLPVALAMVLILPIAFRLSSVYPFERAKGLFEEVYNIATATTATVIVVISVCLIFQPQLNSRLIFLYIVILNTVLVGISRFVISRSLIHLRQYGIGVERTLIVGLGDVGRMVMRNIVARPQIGYQLVGFLDDNPTAGSTDIGNFKALGGTDNLETVLKIQDVQRVIICMPWQSHRTTQRLLRVCDNAQVLAQVVPDLFQFTKSQMVVDELNGIPLISTRSLSIQGWNLFFKRVTDLVLTVAGGLILLPVFAAISVAIWLDSKGPIFYKQIRIGKNNQAFYCYKFRSMVTEADEMRKEMLEQNEATGPLFKMRNDPRCTRVGRFIRRYSLDELPQIYNVLLGEMSLVGPRPNLPEEVAQYQGWHTKRLSVSPGITGLWQVSGRSDLTFDEMVLLDIYYVENWSIPLDISIILRSIPAIIRGRGAY